VKFRFVHVRSVIIMFTYYKVIELGYCPLGGLKFETHGVNDKLFYKFPISIDYCNKDTHLIINVTETNSTEGLLT